MKVNLQGLHRKPARLYLECLGGRGMVEKTTASPKHVITYAVSRNQFLMDSEMVLKDQMRPRLGYKFFQSFGKL